MRKKKSRRDIDPPKKCVGRKDGKFYALIGEGFDIDTDYDYYYLTPWENRFDWKKKTYILKKF